MKRILLIAALLGSLTAAADGVRRSAGDTFLEPLQKRDSVLVGDQLRSGLELKDIADTAALALPEFQLEKDSPLEILGQWQVDSVRVSKRKEVPARYNLKASIVLTAFMGGTYELPDIPVLLDGDTLVFKAAEPLVVTEPVIDMETFQLNDIKPQVKFPYTFKEIAPWIGAAIGIFALVYNLIMLLYLRRKKAIEAEKAEPAHIKALRKLDKYRGDKFWKPEHQKAFYSGVTDTLREYIAARYGVGALEMTTAEIFDGLKKTDVPAELYEEMKDLFVRADFVKFAKFTASDEENAKVLPGAVRFVTETYQQEIAGQAGNDEGVMPGPDRASAGKKE